MKKTILSFAVFALLFTACKNNSGQDEKMDEAGEKMEEAGGNMKDAAGDINDAAKMTADSVEAATERAVQDAKGDMKSTKDAFDAEVAQLKEQIKNASGEAKADLEKKLQDLERKGKAAGF